MVIKIYCISKRILFIFIYLISFKINYNKSLFMLFSVSRREIVFCVTGITIGTMIGYYIGANWRFNSYHTHHIKAIACHHYYGIEVCYAQYNFIISEYRNFMIIILLSGCINDRRC
jgi:hypothetical protein